MIRFLCIFPNLNIQHHHIWSLFCNFFISTLKEINVTGSQKVTDRGISNLLIRSTKSGNVPIETVVNGECTILPNTSTSRIINTECCKLDIIEYIQTCSRNLG